MSAVPQLGFDSPFPSVSFLSAALRDAHAVMHRIGRPYTEGYEDSLTDSRRLLADFSPRRHEIIVDKGEVRPGEDSGVALGNRCGGAQAGYVPCQGLAGFDHIQLRQTYTLLSIPTLPGLTDFSIRVENGQCYHGSVDLKDCHDNFAFTWDALMVDSEMAFYGPPLFSSADFASAELYGTMRLVRPIPFSDTDGRKNMKQVAKGQEEHICFTDSVLPSARWSPCKLDTPVPGSPLDRAIFVALPETLLVPIKAREKMSIDNIGIFQVLVTAYGNAASQGNRQALRLIENSMHQCFTMPRVGLTHSLTQILDNVSSREAEWEECKLSLGIRDPKARHRLFFPLSEPSASVPIGILPELMEDTGDGRESCGSSDPSEDTTPHGARPSKKRVGHARPEKSKYALGRTTTYLGSDPQYRSGKRISARVLSSGEEFQRLHGAIGSF